MTVKLAHENFHRHVVVMDTWLVVEGLDMVSGKAYCDIRPFETSAQALQRHFPDCEVWVGTLLVNAPGNREWIG